MGRTTLAGICLGMLLLAGSAFADSITLQVTGVGGQSLGNVFVAPYMGHLSTNGGVSYGPTFDIICDDYNHDISLGDSWTVDVTPLSSGNLGNTRFANDDGAGIYSELVWLADQMNFQSSPNNNADLQWAMWSLTTTDPSLSLSGLPSADQTEIGNLASLAKGHTMGVDLSGWEVITPTAGAGSPKSGFGQEYLAYTPVPEPSTFVLLGTGIFGVIVSRLKK